MTVNVLKKHILLRLIILSIASIAMKSTNITVKIYVERLIVLLPPIKIETFLKTICNFVVCEFISLLKDFTLNNKVCLDFVM